MPTFIALLSGDVEAVEAFGIDHTFADLFALRRIDPGRVVDSRVRLGERVLPDVGG